MLRPIYPNFYSLTPDSILKLLSTSSQKNLTDVSSTYKVLVAKEAYASFNYQNFNMPQWMQNHKNLKV